MKFDINERREQTLKSSNKPAYLKGIAILVIVYVGISCSIFHKKNPNVSLREHFLDALFWNHSIEITE